MSEISISTISFPSPGTDDECGNSCFHGPTNSVAVFIEGYPLLWGKSELYAIKTALEKQVKLNAEVQRLKDRRKADITAAH